MISFPSFHVAGALMVTWAFRRRHRWLMGLGLLNARLVAATVLTGAHYAIDVVATAAMFAVSIGLWRRFGHPRLGARHPALRDTAIHDAAAA
jgi:membrane-associated phospholipid phosphatase